MSEKSCYHTQSAAYKKFRGCLPEEVVEKITAFVSQKFDPSQCIAVDVGCGSGQGTFPLAPHFKHVYGFDTSSAQIEEAIKDNSADSVTFQTADAETIPLQDGSAHLISARDALHWFDIEPFFKEVDRVLVPNGVLALIIGTAAPTIKGHIEETLELFDQFSEDTAEFWDKRVALAMNYYRDVKLPYAESTRDEQAAVAEEEMTIAQIMSRFRTFSGVITFQKESPEKAEKAIQDFEDSLMKIVGATQSANETKVILVRRHVLVLARKPA